VQWPKPTRPESKESLKIIFDFQNSMDFGIWHGFEKFYKEI
jgi:hypothetical protein